jgi:hypothetical protein
MTLTVTVDPGGVCADALDRYAQSLASEVQNALMDGAGMLANEARAIMAANDNVDRGFLSPSIGTLDVMADSTQVTVTVGPSRDPYPGRDGKTYNDIGAFLERGTSNGGVPWTWKGPEDSMRWAGWHVNWRGSQAHPFLEPALSAMEPAIRTLVADAVSRWSA